MNQVMQDQSEVEALVTGEHVNDAADTMNGERAPEEAAADIDAQPENYDALQAQQDHATEIWLMQMANYIQQYAGTSEAQQAIEQLDQYLRSHPNAEELIANLSPSDRMALEKALFEERSTNVNPAQEAASAAQQTQQQAEAEQQKREEEAEQEETAQERAERYQGDQKFYQSVASIGMFLVGAGVLAQANNDPSVADLGEFAAPATPDLSRGEGLGVNV